MTVFFVGASFNSCAPAIKSKSLQMQADAKIVTCDADGRLIVLTAGNPGPYGGSSLS